MGILMGCGSDQALQQKFMSLTLLVEVSSPFVSFWRAKKEEKWRMALLLVAFFLIRILGFGIYVAYMCYLAVSDNDKFDKRPVHSAIAAAHVLLFVMFVQWFNKQLQIYLRFDPNRSRRNKD